MPQTKLSRLQKWILLAAYDKIENPEPSKVIRYPPTEYEYPPRESGALWPTIDPRTHAEAIIQWRNKRGLEKELTRHEVLMRHFGFSERGPRAWPHRHTIIDRRGRQAAFNAASASLSRALKRLTERGLLRDGSYSSKITLTTDGIEIARELKRLIPD